MINLCPSPTIRTIRSRSAPRTDYQPTIRPEAAGGAPRPAPGHRKWRRTCALSRDSSFDASFAGDARTLTTQPLIRRARALAQAGQ
jgi:hypothetical protein